MVTRRTLLWTGVAIAMGCGGPNEETLIDELRVVAMVAEPPEVAPGESLDLTTWTHIPENSAIERMTWTCVFQGDGCAEATFEDLDRWIQIEDTSTEPDRTHTLEVPETLASLLTGESEEIWVPTWTLACEPGLCPLFEQVRAKPSAGGAEWETLTAALADPYSWMMALPKEGVSLATRTLVVSAREPEQRNQNPRIQATFTNDIQIALEAEETLTFSVEDEDPALTAWGYTTLGGFESVNEEVSGGTVELSLIAPENPEDIGPGEIYIIINDGRGGNSVWLRDFEVIR